MMTLHLSDNYAVDFVKIAVSSYVNTMKQLVQNTFTELYRDSLSSGSSSASMTSRDMLVLVTAFFNLFGLLISLSVVYSVCRFVCWVCVGHQTNASRSECLLVKYCIYLLPTGSAAGSSVGIVFTQSRFWGFSPLRGDTLHRSRLNLAGRSGPRKTVKFVPVVPKAHGRANVCAHRKSIKPWNFQKCFGAFYRGWYVVVHVCSNFSIRYQMAPVQSIKFQTANFPIFCARITVIFWATCTGRQDFFCCNNGQCDAYPASIALPQKGIAFVSSSHLWNFDLGIQWHNCNHVIVQFVCLLCRYIS